MKYMEDILNKLEIGINMRMAIRTHLKLANVAPDEIEEKISELKKLRLYEIQKLNSDLKKGVSREGFVPEGQGISREGLVPSEPGPEPLTNSIKR